MSLTVKLDEVPYCKDSCELFERIIDLPFAVLLDSSFPYSTAGRYDILTAAPSADLCGLATGIEAQQTNSFFEELLTYQREHYLGTQTVSEDIPFCGGLLGYISYDCGNRLHGIEHSKNDQYPNKAPLVQLRAYDWCVIQDHLLRRATLVCRPTVTAQTRRDLIKRLNSKATNTQADFHLKTNFTSNFTPQSYRGAFDRIQEYIRAGDCYQVNLAQRFIAEYQGEPWHAYRALRSVAAAPFSAFFRQAGDNAILSLSPERFLSLHGQHVETEP
ncbi:MAG: chorismate-binding protein, partial [Pseudomonadota bacterium]